MIAIQSATAQESFKKEMMIMGCNFDITLVADSEEEVNKYIQIAIDEMTRIEKLISSWDPNSQTSEINRNAGIRPVQVDKELFDLIKRALDLSRLTDGAFDISFAAVDRVWVFDGSMKKIPTDMEVKESIQRVGFKKVLLDPTTQTVFLTEPGMKIGFGAIGKGYAADKAKALLQSMGVRAGIINASGDMNSWGKQANGAEWKVAITNPMNPIQSYGLLPLKNKAVVTSGSYEKYVELEGQRFAHIINPTTGYPVSGILSVTVFAPKAELADALATSVFIMGQEIGIDRINQLPGIDCIVIDDKGSIHCSENIKIQSL